MEGERCREGDEATGFCDAGLFCDIESELCVAPPGPGSRCLMGSVRRRRVLRLHGGNGENCLDPTGGSTVLCAGDLICGARSCRIAPGAPGCSECPDPDECTVRVCQPMPAAVCGDSGGVLLVL